nr:hypothetical protein [Flavobacterium sp.]
VRHATDIASPLHKNASMILELVAINDINLVLPYHAQIAAVLKYLTDETSIRCFSKICLLLSFRPLARNIREAITEACFDWLIGEHKVAPKAYSMYVLANFADADDWIADELRIIIAKEYSDSQPAFKAAARKVLRQLNKKPQTKD